MNNGVLRLRFEWPGLNVNLLERILGGLGSISKSGDTFVWSLSLGNENRVLEIPVRQGGISTSVTSEAIYLRELESVCHLSTLEPQGGIKHLLRTLDAQSALNAIEQRLNRARDYLEKQRKVYVFAAHRNAVKCAFYCEQIGVDIVAFVDNDVKKQGGEFCGRRIIPLSAVPNDALIINASGRYCIQINEQLRQMNYSCTIDFMELLFLYDLPFQAEEKFRNYSRELVLNRNTVISLYLELADERSRAVLDGLVLFRLTLDSCFAGEQAAPYDQEFFAKDLLCFSRGEVFVDGGAYDGDSFSRFSVLAPNFRKAYLFEPDLKICERAKRTIGNDPRVVICNYGLWSSNTELPFSVTGGMDGAISDSGEDRVSVVSIDNFIDDEVTHIKLDVEGAEEEALCGAVRTIKTNRPKMAIALYHRAADLWRIPTLIGRLGGSYSYGIRHYSHTIDDTVVYAIPVT